MSVLVVYMPRRRSTTYIYWVSIRGPSPATKSHLPPPPPQAPHLQSNSSLTLGSRTSDSSTSFIPSMSLHSVFVVWTWQLQSYVIPRQGRSKFVNSTWLHSIQPVTKHMLDIHFMDASITSVKPLLCTFLCHQMHYKSILRDGLFCGACKENYYPLVYSYAKSVQIKKLGKVSSSWL